MIRDIETGVALKIVISRGRRRPAGRLLRCVWGPGGLRLRQQGPGGQEARYNAEKGAFLFLVFFLHRQMLLITNSSTTLKTVFFLSIYRYLNKSNLYLK